MSRKRIWSNGFDLSIFFFQKAPAFIPWHNGYLFFSRCTFLMLSLKTTAPILLDIFVIQYFTVLVGTLNEKKTIFCRNDLIFVKVGL